jgi:hypothetical protein
MVRRYILTIAAILAAVLSAAIPATAATHGHGHSAGTVSVGRASAPKVLTTPTVDYLMQEKDGTHYNKISTTTVDNPSDYAIRAVMDCENGDHYGSWESGDGSSSASCGSDPPGYLGFFEFDKTHQYVVYCWANDSDPVSGQCGNV